MTPSIFYLDDDELLLQLFQEMFGAKFDIRTSSVVASARLMLREAPADIIICDQIMPDIKGTMFLREAAELCPRSYRILLTGNASVIDVVSEIATGVVQMFISKPWDEGRMLDALERALVEIERK